MKAIRVMLVEDHEIMRFGLVMLLKREADMEVAAEVGDGRTALQMLSEREIDVVVLDLTLPDMEGLQLIKLIQARYPRMPILVSTMHDELRYGDRAIAAGARGYVMKSEHPDVLLNAIRTIALGGNHISDELRDRIALESKEMELRPVTLTDRELEVLGLLGRGFSSTEIAVRLHRSIKTIDAHRENIKKKLALKNANELLRYAVCWVEEEALQKGSEMLSSSGLTSATLPALPTT